ncbi:MAG: major facilitator superfamily 1 [Firmicutes bacterium]|jgi:ACS family hexuronate transporter-like MFS transporter|nr:major facilitator superfamily 1 [Bacillota bacterium]
MLRKRRWQIILMIFIASMINYLDRTAFSVAAPYITKEYGLTPSQLGILFSSFFAGYAIFNFVGGYLSDIYGPRKVFTGAMTVWSIFCGMTAAAFSFTSLLIVRVCFGIGEGPISATTSKTVSNWFPSKERSSAMGIASAGTPLGAAIAGPIVGVIAIYFSWQVAFVVMALIGIVWAFFWWRMAKDLPAEDPSISKEELIEITQGQQVFSNAGKKLPLSYFLKQPTVLLTALAFFAYNYNLFFFLTWFPSYLTMAKGLSIAKMSIVTTLPWFMGFIGLASGGFISDFVFKKTGKLMFSRKIVLVVGLGATAVCVALTGFADSVEWAVGLMSVAIFTLYLTGSTYWALIQDTVSGENVGGVSGFVHFLANLSGVIGPAVTGYIVQSTGVFTSAFVLAGSLALLGSLAVAFFVRPIAQNGIKQAEITQ